MKVFHDKHILRKSLEPSHKVLLYCSRLHLFPRKLRSRWTGTFIVKNIFPYGAIEIENPKNGNIFKVNGQLLKLFLQIFCISFLVLILFLVWFYVYTCFPRLVYSFV